MTARVHLGGRIAAGVLAVSALLAPTVAQASPLFELSGGLHGQGGFNARSVGAGSASTYFNPALLPKAEPGLDVAFMVLHDRIQIDPAPRPPDAVVPANFGEARIPPNEELPPLDAVPTQWLEEGNGGDFSPRPRQQRRDENNASAYAVAGLTVPVFDEWLMFGFYAMVPMGDFARAKSFFVDEREQLFSNSLYAELYEDRLQATSIAFALGSQLHEKVSIGIAATLSLANEAMAPVFVPDASRLGDIRLLSDVNVRVGLAPHGGIHYEPHEDVHLSATVHSPSEFEIVAAYEFTLRDGSTESSAVKFTHAYMPWKFGLGAAWDVLESYAHDVTLATTLEYALWSNYKDRTPRRIDDGGPDVVDTPAPPFGWDNTFSAALGIRYRYRGVHMFADGIFQPTPVPDQTGRTNYVDNHRLGGMFGAEAEFVLAETTFRAGGHFQFHRLIPRSTEKEVADTSGDIPEHLVQDAVPDNAEVLSSGDPFPGREGLQTNNPGYPGFASAGWIIGASVNLSVLF